MNELLHEELSLARTIPLTNQLLRELQEKPTVGDGFLLVDGALWLQAALPEAPL